MSLKGDIAKPHYVIGAKILFVGNVNIRIEIHVRHRDY